MRDKKEVDEEYSSDELVTTLFSDMHSGGGQKTRFDKIFVELPEEAAREWFVKEFHRDPDNVTCTCCGPDFSVTVSKDLRQATAYHRNCESVSVKDGGGHYIEEPQEFAGRVREHVPLEEYVENAASSPDAEGGRNAVLIVTAEELGDPWADEFTAEYEGY